MTKNISTLYFGLAASAVVVGLSLTSLIVPHNTAFGYGECSAPMYLSYEQNPYHADKVRLTWGDYDFSLCGEDLTTKSYNVAVYDLDNNLLIEKTKTRNSKFDLPNAYQNIKWKKLGYNTAVQFRVQAVSDAGTTSSWSDFYEFTTVVQNPTLTITTVSNDNSTNTATVQLAWDTITNQAGFSHYRLKVYEYKYEAIDNNNYHLTTTKLLSKKFIDINHATKELTGLSEWQDLHEESPYDQYIYEAKLFAVYTIAGVKVVSEKSVVTFGLDYSGNVDTDITGPSSDVVL